LLQPQSLCRLAELDQVTKLCQQNQIGVPLRWPKGATADLPARQPPACMSARSKHVSVAL
jgi:hypothetical protein